MRRPLLQSVAARTSLPEAKVKEVLAAVGEQLHEELASSCGEVTIPHVGTYRISDRPAASRVDPRTQEAVVVGPRRVGSFKPSKSLRRYNLPR